MSRRMGHMPGWADRFYSEINIARLLLMLAMILPTLLPFHPKPQAQFLMDALAVFLLCLSLLLGRPQVTSLQCQQKAVLATVGLLLAVVSMRFDVSVTATAYGAYLLLFLLAYAYAAMNGTCISLYVAAALLVCAVLQSIIVFAQTGGLLLHGWILPLAGARAVGNVGHPNVLADLMMLGMAALAHPKLASFGRVIFFLLLFILGVALGLTGSRTAWLGAAVFVLVGRQGFKKKDGNAGWRLLWAAALLMFSQFLVALLNAIGWWAVAPAVTRHGTGTSNSVRRYLIEISWQAIQDRPWFGHGAGTFWRVSVDALQSIPAQSFGMLAEHAHNFPLQVAVEFGVLVSIAICLSAAYWWFSRLRFVLDRNAWALACVGVVAVHSFVEYPLWYAVLLIPCAICMGVVDASSQVNESVGPRRNALFRIAGAFGLVACLWSAMEWLHLRLAYQQLTSASEMTARFMGLSARQELAQISRFSFFEPQVAALNIYSLGVYPDDQRPERALDLCRSGWKNRPTWFELKTCGEQFALAGKEPELLEVLNVLCKGFPDQHPILTDWADEFDRGGKGRLSLRAKACL